MNRADSDEPSEPSRPDGDMAAGVPESQPDMAGEDFAPGNEYGRYQPHERYEPYDEYEPYAQRREDEPLRRQLAQFAFVREEFDREVRLSFRDVPADQIANTFHSAGALLISMTGERALPPSAVAAQPPSAVIDLDAAPEDLPLIGRRRHQHRGSAVPGEDEMSGPPFRPHRHTGELTMRYFFSLRETIYTVNIASPTGIVESIATIYPLAAQCEHELQSRLEVVFRGAASAGESSMENGEFADIPHSPFRIRHSIEPASDLLGWAGRIASAEIGLGYNYVGLEERVADGGLDWAQALSVVEKLCGRCSQANLLAFVQAAEAMSHAMVPPRAGALRLILAESERIVSHLLNAAETMEALGLPDRAYTLRDLRERVIQAIAEWSGARIQPGLIVYGGLTRNMDDGQIRNLTLAIRQVERVLRGAVTSTINSREIAARLVGLGTIRGQEAVVGGLRGPAVRASGVAVDVRAAFPTGAYEDESVTIVVQRNGDAFSRLVVRLLECLESFRVIEQVLDDMPPGPVKARGVLEMREGSGLSRVEGPRGEVFCWVKGSPDGLRGLHISAGSFPTLNILPGLLRDQWLDDLPLILLSVDLCLPCAER